MSQQGGGAQQGDGDSRETGSAPPQEPGAAEALRDVARTWRPVPEQAADALDPGPTAALSAVLGLPGPAANAGEALPPLWHWLHFLRWPPQRELGTDGHPRDGHFLPPVPRRRRMFAGGRLDVRTPLTLGRSAGLTSRVSAVEAKEGRSGPLLFVTVRSEYRQGGELCVTEEQDLVYRSGGAAPVPAGTVPDTVNAPRGDAPWQSPWDTGPVLLFRFSALTANAHRIHYDAPYAMDAEGYPGLVVHGPLLVLSMLELVRREAPGRTVRSLSYRLRKPVFCGERLLTCGQAVPAGEESGTSGDGGREALGGQANVGQAPDRNGSNVRLWVASSRETAHATAEVTLA
jgi:hydroxyacyl-ACP dehydratase HTD2-like protein with hotdog domain